MWFRETGFKQRAEVSQAYNIKLMLFHSGLLRHLGFGKSDEREKEAERSCKDQISKEETGNVLGKEFT